MWPPQGPGIQPAGSTCSLDTLHKVGPSREKAESLSGLGAPVQEDPTLAWEQESGYRGVGWGRCHDCFPRARESRDSLTLPLTIGAPTQDPEGRGQRSGHNLQSLSLWALCVHPVCGHLPHQTLTLGHVPVGTVGRGQGRGDNGDVQPGRRIWGGVREELSEARSGSGVGFWGPGSVGTGDRIRIQHPKRGYRMKSRSGWGVVRGYDGWQPGS